MAALMGAQQVFLAVCCGALAYPVRLKMAVNDGPIGAFHTSSYGLSPSVESGTWCSSPPKCLTDGKHEISSRPSPAL